MTSPTYISEDRQSGTFERRRADWRVGYIAYQIFVDRFAPSSQLEAKREHYVPPRCLREWNELPQRGDWLPEEKNSEAELEFWGGDLQSVRGRIDHIKNLGIDLVYLNPIFKAFTNHKYDAMDYFEVDPQYGAMTDLRELADDLHGMGVRLMLDGVFNHMGRRAPLFQKALAQVAEPSGDAVEHTFFSFDQRYKQGYAAWRDVPNLPELRLEEPHVRDMLWNGADSVVKTYLREADIDGWRLDVAYDVGLQYLHELTEAAHSTKPESVVIGECWNYPEEWLHALDGIMLMHVRALLFAWLDGRIPSSTFGDAIDQIIEDCDFEKLLQSHLILENHDTARMPTLLPDFRQQKLAWVTHMTLPGCPVIYYGAELGMEGGHDPGSRAPMRWDLANAPKNETREFVNKLLTIRNENAALRIGNYRSLHAHQLLGFIRYTDLAHETIIVLVNASGQEVSEIVQIRDSRLMDADNWRCLLTGNEIRPHAGTIEVTLPPHSARLYRTLDTGEGYRYSMIKRVP